MKSLISALLLVHCTLFLVAQNPVPPENAPNHFRWSEREAHELDYNRTIRLSTELSTEEKKSLIAVIVQILKCEEGEDMTASERTHLASETRIELVDLNGDGRKEVIAQANGFGPCGGTGNGVFWIFQLTPSGTKVLLDTTLFDRRTYELITVRPWMTNGFRDIVLASDSSATGRNITWYRYVNGRYRPSGCYYLNWTGDNGESLMKSPDISNRPCR